MKFKIPYLRWCIAFTLFLGLMLNYLDRNILGLLAPTIQKDLGISDQQYATMINWFLGAYTFAYLMSGRLVDKIGVKLSMALFVIWWSISNALTGIAQSFRSLSVYRFSLGLGEAGGFTASPKAVSEWFPPSERGMAVGIYSIGSAIGTTIAPLIVAYVAVPYGWRWVFGVTSILSLPFLILWFWIYKKPSDHPSITDSEKKYILTNLETEKKSKPDESHIKVSMLEVLKQPFVWKLMIARLLADSVNYFYPFWMPKYLHTVRGMDQKGLSILWICALGGDIGLLLGGFFVRMLVKKGHQVLKSRLTIMTLSALMIPLTFFIPSVPDIKGVVAIATIVGFAGAVWLVNISALVVDISPKPYLATAFGLIAGGSVLGGMGMNKLVAWFITNKSYDDCIHFISFLPPLGLILLWTVLPRKHANQTPLTS